ncbi:MAG: alpha glucosidase [Hyphomicrobiaceae bacterium]|nr:alpha glucosidase [Hyphomicrobiaceae bacterium]
MAPSTQVHPDQMRTGDPDWWRGGVIYQIYPRSFQDHTGDGIGDLPGITERLPYVSDLGVDAIWLSPFFTSPMKDFGYDVSNYRDVDPSFGTIEDFDRLVQRAHELGLRVIIDQVISHSSDEHPWFAESRRSRDNARADWYVWADPKDDGTAPNNWLSIFGGSAWHWDARRKQYYLHNFLSSQPDLNFHNPKVQEALLDEMRFWLERGVDGFRLDTVNFYFHAQSLMDNPALPKDQINTSTAPDVNPYNFQSHRYDKSQPENLDFLARLRSLLDEFPGTTSVGEVGDAERQVEIMAAYTSGKSRLHMAYTFDYLGGVFTAEHFAEAIEAVNQMADSWQCLAFSNHDVMRHISRWSPAGREDQFARFAAMILLTMRGSVCLYQGEELALPEAEISFEDVVDPYGREFWPEYKGRDGCRTPMVWQSNAHLGGFTSAPRAWLPVPANHIDHAVDLQLHGEQESVLDFYRGFLAFRKAHAALIKGTIEVISSTNNVLAFVREEGDQKIVCAFNMGFEEDAVFAAPAGMRLEAMDAPGSQNIEDDGTVLLMPLTGFIGTLTAA